MIFVGARAGDHFHLRAGATAVFGLAAFRHDAKFTDRVSVIRCERKTKTRNQRIVHVNAIKPYVITTLALSVHVRETWIARIDLYSRLEDGQSDGRSAQRRQNVNVMHRD